MSVTICWRPTSEIPKHFEGGTSSSLEVLKGVFHGKISEKHVDTLRAMAASARDEFYNEIADKVEQVGEIEFWGEY